LKENVLDKKPRNSIESTVPTATAIESEIRPTDNVGTANHTDDTWKQLLDPSQDDRRLERDGAKFEPTADPTELGKGIIRPSPMIRSPSAYETAEKFMVDSTKQIASWSGEAVSGVLKSSTPFGPSKPKTGAELQEEGDHVPDLQAAEEEQEKKRILDRRVIREISSIFRTGFYFSTEFDLLSSKQTRSDYSKGSKRDAPLWQQVVKRFWWNEHLLKEFLDIKVQPATHLLR
jgi:hypothetical protein